MTTESPLFISSIQCNNTYTYVTNTVTAIQRRPIFPTEIWIDVEEITNEPPEQTPYPGTVSGIVSGISGVEMDLMEGSDVQLSNPQGQFIYAVPGTYANSAYQPTLVDSAGTVIPNSPTVWVFDSVLGIIDFQQKGPVALGYVLPLYISYWKYLGRFAIGPDPPVPPAPAIFQLVDDPVTEQGLLSQTPSALERNIVFNAVSTENTTGAEPKLILDSYNRAFRGGFVSGTAWDISNRGGYSTAFGKDTKASGTSSTVAGGDSSIASAEYSTIGGGCLNSAVSQYSTIGGGYYNYTDGTASTIGGGQNNVVTRQYATVGGGYANANYSNYSTIGGGRDNYIDSDGNDHSVVAGGYNNKINPIDMSNSGVNVVISGGDSNVIGMGQSSNVNHTIIAGGYFNSIGGGVASGNDASVIGGGYSNIIGEGQYAANYSSIIAGGESNTINGISTINALSTHSAIVGGRSNSIYGGNYSFMGAGQGNVVGQPVDAQYGVLVGGAGNSIGDQYSSIITGSSNTVNGLYSQIMNGSSNIITSTNGVIVNGASNTIGNDYNFSYIGNGSSNLIATPSLAKAKKDEAAKALVPNGYVSILNGMQNVAGNAYTTVVNGMQNVVNNIHSAVLCGFYNNVSADYSFIGGGSQNHIVSLTLGYSTILNGYYNILRGAYSTILNGNNCFITSNVESASMLYNTILGGLNNIINVTKIDPGFDPISTQNIIANGETNRIGDGNDSFVTRASVINGNNNQISNGNTSYTEAAMIGSGQGNTICSGGGSESWAGAIMNGYYNTICSGEGSSSSINFIGGGASNNIASGINSVSDGATILCGGGNNIALGTNSFGYNSVICAGLNNFIANADNSIVGSAFIGAGISNYIGTAPNIECSNSAIIAGSSNSVGGVESLNSTVCGGSGNAIMGSHSIILGGYYNNAASNNACVGGTSAQSLHDNVFVWNDGTMPLASTAPNSFVVAALGGTTFISDSSQSLGVKLDHEASAWSALSDRNAKENLCEMDYPTVLKRIDEMPIYEYNYRNTSAQFRCRGPVAQDWHAAFPSAKDPLRIDTMDLDGITLAAVKGLISEVKSLREEITALKNDNILNDKHKEKPKRKKNMI